MSKRKVNRNSHNKEKVKNTKAEMPKPTKHNRKHKVSPRRKLMVISHYKLRKQRKENTTMDIEPIIDESVTTNATEETFTEQDYQEVFKKAKGGIAYYQMLLSKHIKKENKDCHCNESLAWVMRAALSGCSLAEVYVLDNIESLITAILGNPNNIVNKSLSNDIFLIYSLGYFLINFKNLKKKKTYEEWQEIDTSEAIKVNFNGSNYYTNANNRVLENNTKKQNLNLNLNNNNHNSKLANNVNKNLLSCFNFSSEANKKNLNQNKCEFIYKPKDTNCYEQLGFILLNKASDKNYILARLEVLRKELLVNPNANNARKEYLSLLTSAAEQGIDRAQYMFVEEFLLNNKNGLQSDKILDKCYHYLESSAENGYCFSQFQFAKIKESGSYDFVKSHHDAFYWCTKAAEHGFAEAEFTLSTYYFSGIGTKKNEKTAFEYMLRADNSYHPEASLYICLKYKEGTGCDVDEKQAYKFAKKCFFNYRNIEAAFVLGGFYLNGFGTPENLNAAIKCFSYAAKNGNIRANYMLGELYYKGIGTEINFTKAFSYYKKGALANDAKSLCKLSLCFLLGNGIYRDTHRALACLNTASHLDIDEVDKFISADDGQNIKLFESLCKIKYLVDSDEKSRDKYD